LHAACLDLPLLEHYEILGVQGRGGMGIVYRARQRGFNRLVALKMIVTSGFADTEDKARFRAEAEAVARLTQPNIVQVYEVGQTGRRPFFSMEYAQGGSLASRLNSTPLPSRGRGLWPVSSWTSTFSREKTFPSIETIGPRAHVIVWGAPWRVIPNA
jgi:serine/threonine protein kinase